MGLLFLCVFTLLTFLSAAQKFKVCTSPRTNCQNLPALNATAEYTEELKPDKFVRVRGARTKGSFTPALLSDPARRQAVLDYVDFLKRAETGIAAKNNETKGSDCNLRNSDWTKEAVNAVGKYRKIGALDKACTTAFEHTARDKRRATGLFRRLAEAFLDASDEVKGNWTAVHPLTRWRYSSSADEQECDIETAAAIKYRGKWHVQARVTNFPTINFVPTHKRLFYEEWVPEDFCCPLTMYSKDFALNATDDNFFETGEFEPYRVLSVTGSGPADLSAFYRMDFDDNRPLSRALLANALAVDQALDAVRPSNIAILALPMAMSFIPVAVIADVNDFAAFIFIIFTDFFSAIPFIIKGLELLDTGTKVQRDAETLIVGSGDLQVAESWVVACQPVPTYKRDGIIFIVIGLAVMCSGFFLEYVARRYMRKRIMQGEIPRPLGPALFPVSHPTRHPYIPRDYDDGDENAPNFAADMDVPPPPPTQAPPFTSLYRRFVRNRRPVAVPADDDTGATARQVLGTGAGLESFPSVNVTVHEPYADAPPQMEEDTWFKAP